MLNKITLLFCALTLIGCSAIQPKSKPHSHNAHPQSIEETEPQFPITQQLLELEKNKGYFQACDIVLHEQKKELLERIDQNSELIKLQLEESNNKKQAKSKDLEKISFGPTWLWRSKAKRAPQKNAWIGDIVSWKDIIRYYLSVKDKPDNEIDWLWLSKWSQYILSDDRDRILGGLLMRINQESEPLLLGIIGKLDSCLQSKSCSPTLFDEEEFNFLINSTTYAVFLKSNPSLSDYEGLKAEVKGTYDDNFGFYKYTNAVRLNEDTLQVPLYTTDFRGYEQAFADIVLSLWNNDKIKIELLWIDTVLGRIYKIIFRNLISGRSNVYYQRAEMNLYPNISDTVLIHEFGHVLGFNDRYYKVWNQSTCSYIQYMNPADIMSNHTTGSALPYHIEKLKSEYPLSESIIGDSR